MQWIFSFLGLFFAVITGENAFVSGLLGFLFGSYISLSPRINKIELQLDELQRELYQRKHPQTAETKTDNKFVESPPEAIAKTSITQESTHEQVRYIKPQLEPECKPLVSAPVPWLEKDNEQRIIKETPKTRQVKVDYTGPSFKQVETPAYTKLFQYIWNWFTDGNTFVRVGIVILFVGVSFLLNLAIDKGYIPIELRLSVVAGFALFLLSVGWKLRNKRAGYALLIQGGQLVYYI